MPNRILDRSNISATDSGTVRSEHSVAFSQQIAFADVIPAEALENALDSALAGVPLAVVAQSIFYRQERVLAPFMRQCTINRILLELRRARLARSRKTQMRLPGFEAIPQRLPRSDGKGRRKLMRATYRDVLRYYQRELRKAKDAPKVVQAKALAELMAKHSEFGITVGEVLEREGVRPQLPD
jgi:hypothetical protein